MSMKAFCEPPLVLSTYSYTWNFSFNFIENQYAKYLHFAWKKCFIYRTYEL